MKISFFAHPSMQKMGNQRQSIANNDTVKFYSQKSNGEDVPSFFNNALTMVMLLEHPWISNQKLQFHSLPRPSVSTLKTLSTEDSK